MAQRAGVPVWGSVEATVEAVIQALVERAERNGAGRERPSHGPAGQPPGRGRRFRRPVRRAPLAQRYEAWRRRWGRAAAVRAQLRGRRPLLDVGCAEGRLAARLARATGRPVVGVDVSDTGFGRAFEEASRLGVDHLVGCVRRDAHHLSALGRERFAAATFTYSLHCMRDPERAVAEVATLLAPGGVLLVVDWVLRPGDAPHGCTRLTAGQVEAMMRHAGLVVLQSVARSGVGLIAAEKPRASPA